ncbi:hypothetical protein EPN96_06340 [bacterium]|nr:MAG: hypothetical protein EPN96_06340 [bacterium]
MRTIRPHRLLAAWFVLMCAFDIGVLFLNRILEADILPEPTMAEFRWTVFYAFLQLLAAFNLWRSDPFGWHVGLFATILRLLEGTIWEFMNPLPGAALLATGVGLIYHGYILTALDSKSLRRIFPNRKGPFAKLGDLSMALRIAGASVTFYHFAGFFGGVVPPLLWFAFRTREAMDAGKAGK